jgi:hypothetical protein
VIVQVGKLLGEICFVMFEQLLEKSIDKTLEECFCVRAFTVLDDLVAIFCRVSRDNHTENGHYETYGGGQSCCTLSPKDWLPSITTFVPCGDKPAMGLGDIAWYEGQCKAEQEQ